MSQISKQRILKPLPNNDSSSAGGSFVTDPMIKFKRVRARERLGFVEKLREPSLDEQLQSDQAFRDFIKLALCDYGVSQSDLAETLGVSTAAVSRWKAGVNAPPGYGRIHIKNIVADIITKESQADLNGSDLM